jgi:hypothetical protein
MRQYLMRRGSYSADLQVRSAWETAAARANSNGHQQDELAFQIPDGTMQGQLIVTARIAIAAAVLLTTMVVAAAQVEPPDCTAKARYGPEATPPFTDAEALAPAAQDAAAIPEPGVLAFTLLGAAGLCAAQRFLGRRR